MSQKKNEQQNLNLDNCAPNCAVAEQVLSTDKAAKHGLSLLNKLLPLWIVLTMVIGLLIGKFVSGSNVELLPLPLVLSNMFSGKFSYDFSNFLSLGLPLGLFLMIFPAMAKLHLEDAKKAITNFRALGIVLFFTFMVAPFMLWILGNIFLQNYPELWIGLILLGVAPCIAMVLVWTDLAGGNNAIAIVVMVWNSLGQIVMTPIFIWLIIGSKVHIDISLIIEMVLIYLGLPLVAGIATRNILIKHKGHTWFKGVFTPIINKVQFFALLFTLMVLFALKGDVIISKPELIPLMALPLTIYFIIMFYLSYNVARLFKFNVRDRIAVAFNASGNNFELSIAIALTAFSAQKMVAVSTVVGPLIEVPVMLFLVSVAKRALAKEAGLTEPITTTHQDVYEDDQI